MSINTHLQFLQTIGSKKPKTINNQVASCPFCQVDQLENILVEKGSIILLKNKFPTLKDTFQTVLIETDDCQSEFSLYPKEHLYRLMDFAVSQWLQMSKSGEYQSVLLFKNHGPLSGGTIRHPHMQIVGLKYVDYRENIKENDFVGVEIASKRSVEFNISSEPRMGFYEYNVNLTNLEDLSIMADYIQMAAHYILNHNRFKCESYNLFFYQLHNRISCKIIPRYATTPLFIGYSIPQVSNDLDGTVERIKDIYHI
ncbi:DUF4931 domain-containing protein [Heyndrickxia sporothermodurans]|nr:DUF4931 domain-containing protein [Heyndrickxia sporothermodurans]